MVGGGNRGREEPGVGFEAVVGDQDLLSRSSSRRQATLLHSILIFYGTGNGSEYSYNDGGRSPIFKL